MTPQSATQKGKRIFWQSCNLATFIIVTIYVFNILADRMHKIPFSRLDLFLTLVFSWLSVFVLVCYTNKLVETLKEWKKIISEKKNEFRSVYNIDPGVANADLAVSRFLTNLLISLTVHEFVLAQLNKNRFLIWEFNQKIDIQLKKIQEIQNSLLDATKIASEWNFEIPESVLKYLNKK